MWEVEKKVRKRKSEIEEKSVWKHFSKDRTSANTSALMSIASASLLWSVFLHTLQFHIFMTLKYFVKNRVIFIVSLEEKKIIVLISIRYWC